MVQDFALQQDTSRIFRAGTRVTRCKWLNAFVSTVGLLYHKVIVSAHRGPLL